jgi:hypothetical protein
MMSPNPTNKPKGDGMVNPESFIGEMRESIEQTVEDLP